MEVNEKKKEVESEHKKENNVGEELFKQFQSLQDLIKLESEKYNSCKITN